MPKPTKSRSPIRWLIHQLNPFINLGKKQQNILFPLIFMFVWTIGLEAYAQVIAKNPTIVGLPAIVLNIVFIVYFSLRNGMRAGFIATVITILYYAYILYSRHYTGARLANSINVTIALGVVYFIISAVIGWLKQTVDDLIDKEKQARIHAEDAKTRLESILDHQKEIEGRKDDFINMASHELKTPLTSTKLFTKSLEKHLKTNKDERGQQLLGKIDKQLVKLTHLVRELLDVTNINQGKLRLNEESFTINDAVREVIEDLQPTTQQKLQFKQTTNQKVVADREKIMQVLANLITNAIKYSDSDDIIIATKKDNHTVIVSVQDFGIGISKEQQKKIFARFYQAHQTDENTYPGIGLGLFIASEITRLHKGKIWVESTQGKGSTFYFSLPIKK